LPERNPVIHDVFFLAAFAAVSSHVAPDIVLFSTMSISAPHLGHCVRDGAAAGLRRELSLNHEGHFI
jgi:hypothetical protein